MKIIRWFLTGVIIMNLINSCQSGKMNEETSYKSPDWFKKAVLYEIFVRSFRDSNNDGIGDLKGITQSLDYLQELGVTTLWLTPIFPSPSYHGYDITDYYSINPDFGSIDDLIELVNSVHQRGMYIVLDFVASHTSNQHPFFQDALNNPDSDYAGFYLWKDETHKTYHSYQDYLSMPTVNHGSDLVNKYFVEVAKYWMDPDQDGDYTDGIDGWRCDYAIGAPESFWRLMRSELKALNPDFLLLGEVWVKEPSGQTGYFDNAFDAQFDFPLYFVLEGDPAISQDGLISGKSLVSLATERVEAGKTLFSPESILIRFINNHDMDRSASEVSGDLQREKLGALLMMALDGVPMIYYGEEIGMSGERGNGTFSDEYRREPMEWNARNNTSGTANWFKDHRFIQDMDGISVEEQNADPSSLLNFYRAVIKLRQENKALLNGRYLQITITPVNTQVWAFWRYEDDQIIGAFFNFGEEQVTFQIENNQVLSIRNDQPTALIYSGQYNLDAGGISLAPASVVLFDFTP